MRTILRIVSLWFITLSVIYLAEGQETDTQSAHLKPFPTEDRTATNTFTLEPLQTGIYNVLFNDGNAWGYELRQPVPAPSMQPGYSVALWAWRQTGSTDNSFVFEVVNTVWEEKEATVTAKCWWDPVAGEGTGNSQGEVPGPIHGWAKGIANHLKGHLQLTELAILDPPDYLCINESLDMSAWVVRPEDFPWDFRESVDVEWEVAPNGSGTFVPSEGHSVTFTPLETGDVTITATVPGTDGPITESITITIFKVQVEEIRFDHDTSSMTTDGVTMKKDKDKDTDIIAPEWKPADSKNDPGCYIRSTTPKVKVKLKVQPDSITSAKIRAVSKNGRLPNLDEKSVSFSGGVSGLDEVTMSSALPGMVTNILDYWQWIVSDVNGSGSAECDVDKTGEHKVFVILDTPTKPMDKPWEGVLDYACSADWASGRTTVSLGLSAIVSKLYLTLAYQESSRYVTVSVLGKQTFDLTQFLADGLTQSLNCVDFSDLAIIFANAIGGDYDYRRKFPGNGSIITYYISEAGPTRYWFTKAFPLHQFVDDSGTIWDASLGLDGDGTPSALPCTPAKGHGVEYDNVP